MLHFQLSLSLLLIAACCMPTHSQRVITCEGRSNVHRLACGENEAISVQRALYGRRDRRTCSAGHPPSELRDIRCIQDGTMAILSDRCDGKQVCEVSMQVFKFSDPCVGTYKYLDTTYACIPANPVVTLVSCEGKNAVLNCGQKVINVLSANYGRRDIQICSAGRPTDQVSETDCVQSSTLSEMVNRCQGRSQCTVPATNGVFGDPCYGTYKYLQVFYTCVGRSR